MADGREFLITLRSAADLAGVQQMQGSLQAANNVVQKLDASVQQAGVSFMEITRGSDLKDMQAHVAAVEAEFGALSREATTANNVVKVLTATSEHLNQVQRAGKMTDEKAALEWSKALSTAEEKLTGITAKTQQASSSMNVMVGAMRISNERMVMMGSALGGLATQMSLGADNTQVFASAMTNVAMIMSTGGPWGMAASFVLQALSSIGLAYIKNAQEAEKAAEKQAEAQKQATESIRNASIREDEWQQRIKRGNNVIEQRYDLTARLTEIDKQYTDQKNSQADAEARLAEVQDRNAVNSGDMTAEEAANRARERDQEALNQRQKAELDSKIAERDAALAEKEKAVSEYSSLDKGAAAAGQKFKDAKTASVSQKQAEAAKQEVAKLSAELETIENTQAAKIAAGQVDPYWQAIIDDLKAKIQTQKEIQITNEKTVESLGRFDTKDGKIDVDKYRNEARKADEELQNKTPGLKQAVDKANDKIMDAEDKIRATQARQNTEQQTLEAQQQPAIDAMKEKDNLEFAKGQAEVSLNRDAEDLQAYLTSAAKEVQGSNKQQADGFRALADTLKDGAIGKELEAIGRGIESSLGSTNAMLNTIAQMISKTAAQAMAKAAEVERLNSQMDRVNQVLSSIR